MAASSTSFTKGNKVHLQSKVKRIPPPPIATRDELMRALTKRIRNGTFKHQVYLMAVKLLSDMQDKAYDERREEKLLQAMSSEELQAILVERSSYSPIKPYRFVTKDK